MSNLIQGMSLKDQYRVQVLEYQDHQECGRCELLSSSGKTIEEIENGLNEKREPGVLPVTGTFLDATSRQPREMITTRKCSNET
ncbi:MAG: hypothetical protein R2744_03900 [Bacteroidales bacterium]